MNKINCLTGVILIFLAVNLSTACFAGEDSSMVNVQCERTTEQELREVITNIKYQLISAQKEIERLQENNYNLKNTLSEQNGRIEALIKEQTLLNQAVSSKENEIQKLSGTNSELKNLVSNYRQKAEDLTLRVMSMDNELTQTQGNNLTYTRNYDQLMKEKKELERNCSDLQSKISKMEQEKLAISSAVSSTNQSLQNQSIYLKAIDYMKQSKTNSAIFYYNLAKAYQDIKNYLYAMDNYKLALDANPDLAPAHRELGIIYAESGRYGDSVSELNKYLKYVRNPQEEKLIKDFISKIEASSQQ